MHELKKAIEAVLEAEEDAGLAEQGDGYSEADFVLWNQITCLRTVYESVKEKL